MAREFERRWEEARKNQRQLEDERERWSRFEPVRLTDKDERASRSLAAELPAVWEAAATTSAERKLIARILIDSTEVTVDKGSERVDATIHYGGCLVVHCS